jgi:prepilin-type N-terminal cleavage/methylation domain-containing protein
LYSVAGGTNIRPKSRPARQHHRAWQFPYFVARHVSDILPIEPIRWENERMIRRRAFTLAEMLVVIAMIVMLLAILLPILPRAREHAWQVQCMSNMRQVTQALLQYTSDWDGRFYPLDPPGGQAGMAAKQDDSQVIPWLYGYLRSPAVFHCPGDPRDNRLTYSVNDFLGGAWPSYANPSPAKRLLDVRNAAMTFAMIEEIDFVPRQSINPGGFVVEPAPSAAWADAPAVLHGRGTCITFVDGHCEYWIWSDPRTPSLSSRLHNTRTPNNPDLPRLQSIVGNE